MERVFPSKSLKYRLIGVVMGGVLAVSIGAGMNPAAAAPAATSPVPLTTVASTVSDCSGSFFGLVPWYNYMEESIASAPNTAKGIRKCDIVCFNFFPQAKANECGQQKSDIPGILLAIIDDFLRIAGLVAVGFIIVGAFQYVESRGNSERASRAQSSIINALIGLVIAMVAVGFISFLGGRL